LELYDLGKVLFTGVSKQLEENGSMLREGCVVDVRIISAPSFIKNESGQRDPDMHQTIGTSAGRCTSVSITRWA
jgi:IS5 family transposase